MKKLFRTLAIGTTAVVGLASVAMFAGCDTNYPEVTITYEFRGEKYEVEYTLSRKGAPQTVQHFIELADAGYYDDTVIHDYQTDGSLLYGGAYTWDPAAENGTGGLVEKDYWTEVRKLEAEGAQFTQTVYADGSIMSGYLSDMASDGLQYEAAGTVYTAEDEKIPLYTLHGEFKDNAVSANDKTYTHLQGTLAMFYTEKGTGSDARVGTIRSDGGAGNGGEAYQTNCGYKYNSATSIFYTFTGSGMRPDLDTSYSAFGRTVDFEGQLRPLLDAINEYAEGLELSDDDDDNSAFTDLHTFTLNTFDPIDSVRNAGIRADYSVPVEPIYIRSVHVDKY